MASLILHLDMQLSNSIEIKIKIKIKLKERNTRMKPGSSPRSCQMEKAAQLSETLGITMDSAGSQSCDQDNEGIAKELHCSASTTARRKACKRKTKLKDGMSESKVSVLRCSNRFRDQMRGCRNNNCTTTAEREKLDSGTFSRYLMHIWGAFPEEKVKSATYLDPLWFGLYNQNNRGRVLRWIEKKGVFSKKYVFMPIVMWSHWNLLIFCHLGQSLHSKTNVPCMLLLDSLQSMGPTQLEPRIRRLLFDIYESEGRPESKSQLLKMPLLIPKVPQQKKDKECGFYVLYYMHLFLERAPESFNTSEGYPYFMKKDWFTDEEVESFCKTLDALPIDESESEHATMDSSDSVQVVVRDLVSYIIVD